TWPPPSVTLTSVVSAFGPSTTHRTPGPRPRDPTLTNDPEPDLERLWAEYKDTGAQTLRDQLIVHYSPLVKYVAGRVATGLPQNVDQADLVSYGIFGLIDAIEKFDLDRGFKFETYAIARIKGN